jgi:hypothetical protein
MAVMLDADRKAVWAEMMADASARLEGLGLLKADLRAAVNALDDFLSTNGAAINTAIPLPARTALTVPQKARLLMFVIQRRYLSGA